MTFYFLLLFRLHFIYNKFKINENVSVFYLILQSFDATQPTVRTQNFKAFESHYLFCSGPKLVNEVTKWSL